MSMWSKTAFLFFWAGIGLANSAALASDTSNTRECAIQGLLVQSIAKESRTRNVSTMDTAVVQHGMRDGFGDYVTFLAKSADVMSGFPLDSVTDYYAFACFVNFTGADMKLLVAKASDACARVRQENERITCLKSFLDSLARSMGQGPSK